uniref:Uncharacterized protein n=1 Tax=Rhizophora mucronata TaxID=61149 RepID=A0A2P2PRM2_RHIMU
MQAFSPTEASNKFHLVMFQCCTGICSLHCDAKKILVECSFDQ